MNSATRFVVLSIATCGLTLALVNKASGQQPQQRGVGNSAEVERLERERRDREMREADMSERQYLLRTMEPDRRPAGLPAPRLALAQIREDFVRFPVAEMGGTTRGGSCRVTTAPGEIGVLDRRVNTTSLLDA